MYTPTQLEAIRIFGSKELTEGCYITYTWNPRFGKDWNPRFGKDGNPYLAMLRHDSIYEAKSKNCFGLLHLAESEEELNEIQGLHGIKREILGHIPHLEDVFRVAKEKRFHYIDITHLSDGTHELCFAWTGETDDECIPYNPTLQLLEQSESTLQKLISLFE